MARHPAPFVLGLAAAAAAAGCAAGPGDRADLARAPAPELRRAVDAASGADALEAGQFAVALAAIGEASACPRVEHDGATTVITGGCDGPGVGPIAGRAVLEAAAPGTARGAMARATFEGFGDRERTFDGVVELSDGALAADLQILAGGLVAHVRLAAACDGVGLCAADAGAAIDLDGLGHVEVAGAWRLSPPGGYLTLIGQQTVTFDLNAADAAGCLPYTIDGVPGGRLCD